jgi:electron-transferring-flavoprotein dehydrogenase
MNSGADQDRRATSFRRRRSMHNHGNVIVSLGAMCAWLARRPKPWVSTEIYPGFAAAKALFNDDGKVGGVRIGDMGVAKDGSHKPGYTPGIDIRAGHRARPKARAALTKQLIKRFARMRLRSANLFASASRNCGRCPKAASSPARSCTRWAGRSTTPTAAASCITSTTIASRSATSRPGLPGSATTSRSKPSSNGSIIPLKTALLEGGRLLSAGARAIVTGGWQSLPKVEMPGALLIGDTAGLLNVPKIKGTHQAMRSGMLAAEHLRRDRRADRLRRQTARVGAMKELKQGAQHQARLQARPVVRHANAGWETGHRRRCRRGR